MASQSEFRQYAEIVSGLLTVVAVRVPGGKEEATVESHLERAGPCAMTSPVLCMPWLRDTKMEKRNSGLIFLLLCPVDCCSAAGCGGGQQLCAVYDPGALLVTAQPGRLSEREGGCVIGLESVVCKKE